MLTASASTTQYMHGQGGLMATPGLGRKVAKGSVQQTMHEFKHGTLRSSSGNPVTNRRQALAIALSEAARAKKSISATERKKIPASDFAGPHDSYPIRNQQEVNSAARLAGHAANPAAVRAAIKRIAQRKGLKLPASWQKKAVTKDATPQEHTGVMIAFMLPPYAAEPLAIPGGEAPEELHLTLCFLGDSQELGPDVLESLKQALAEFAATASPVKGEISGVGLFNTAEEGEPNALWASFDAPLLPRFHSALVQAVIEAGVPYNPNHGFTPHITLAYIPKGQAIPPLELPNAQVIFDAVTLAWGDEHTTFPLGGVTKDVNNAPNLRELSYGNYNTCSSCEFAGPLTNGIFCEKYLFTTQSFWTCDSYVEEMNPALWRLPYLQEAGNNEGAVQSYVEANAPLPATTLETLKPYLRASQDRTTISFLERQPLAETVNIVKALGLTTKAANYHATGGQVIAGRLARGKNGKFTSSGASEAPADPADAGKTDAQRIAESKVRATQSAEAAGPKGKGGGGKGKGGGSKGKAGKPSPEQQAANAGKLLTSTLGPDLAEALTVGNPPGDLSGIKSDYGDQLVKLGLAIKYNDGTYALTGAGKSALTAAGAGDSAKLQKALQLGQSRKSGVASSKQPAAGAGKKPPAATKPTTTAKIPAVKPAASPKTTLGSKLLSLKPKAAPKPKAPAAPKTPKTAPLTPEQKKAALAAQKKDNLQKVAQKLSNSNLAEIFTVGDDPRDMSQLNDAGKKTLMDTGLGSKHTNGSVELNSTGLAVVSAMESGNVAEANRLIAHAQAVAQDAAAKLAAQQAAAEAKRVRAAIPKETQNFFVFKDKLGKWRWLTFSSSSYEDKDGETIAQKALEQDVIRADQTGDYGPLLWWHIPGMKIGDCDFNMMMGRILVESGTFVNEFVAKSMAACAKILGVSIGFKPFPPFRGPGRVFTEITRKERSLLPDFAASNYLTKLFIGVNPQARLNMDEKIEALKAALGGGPEADDMIRALSQFALTAEKEAQAQGLAFKASGAAPTVAAPADPAKKPDELPAQAAVPPVPVKKDDGTLMADQTAGLDPEAGAAEEFEGSEADDTIDQIIQALHDGLDGKILTSIKEALQPFMDGMQGLTDATIATKAASDTAALALKETVQLIGKMGGQITELEKRLASSEQALKELNGEVPRGLVRASTSPDTVVDKAKVEELIAQHSPAAQNGASKDPLDDFLAPFLARMSGQTQAN